MVELPEIPEPSVKAELLEFLVESSGISQILDKYSLRQDLFPRVYRE